METKQFKQFNIKPKQNNFTGDKIPVDQVLNVEITVLDYVIEPSTRNIGQDRLKLQIEKQGIKRIIFSGSVYLMDTIKKVAKDDFPFITTIVKTESKSLEFT